MAMTSTQGEHVVERVRGVGFRDVARADKVADDGGVDATEDILEVQVVDEVAALRTASCLFSGFGDASRLAILQHLALGEHRVVDLTAHLDLAQSTVSKHLALLKDCGLVTVRPVGRASVYALANPAELLDLLAAAERLLASSGDAVRLCPTHHASAASPPATHTAETRAAESLDG